MNDDKEYLIMPRFNFMPIKGIDNTERIARLNVGDGYSISVGAPGVGHVLYRVTRIDPEGVWGVMVENTVRELEPWEVE